MRWNFLHRLNAWLGQQEHRHKFVIYQCDPDPASKWTSLCLRQADLILDVAVAATPKEEDAEGSAEAPWEVTRAERSLERAARRTRKELVLVHPEGTVCPRGTREWLRRRPWISAHFHLLLPGGRRGRMFDPGRPEASVDAYYARAAAAGTSGGLGSAPNIHSDFSRLARHVSGKKMLDTLKFRFPPLI